MAKGCTQKEIQALENVLGLKLPSHYCQYLAQYGHRPGPALVGSDCSYPVLPELKEWAEELLDECGQPFQLEETDFVFLMHQGYQFLYFKADGASDDPSVYHFREGQKEPKLLAESFTKWLTLLENK